MKSKFDIGNLLYFVYESRIYLRKVENILINVKRKEVSYEFILHSYSGGERRIISKEECSCFKSMAKLASGHKVDSDFIQ